MSFIIPKCDQCDKTATTLCIDIKRIDKPGDDCTAYEPIGPKKAGCDDHPVKTRSFLHDGVTLEIWQEE